MVYNANCQLAVKLGCRVFVCHCCVGFVVMVFRQIEVAVLNNFAPARPEAMLIEKAGLLLIETKSLSTEQLQN